MEFLLAIQEEMNANTKTVLAEMKADSKAWQEEIQAETEAIQARMKAMREERMKANMDACMADIKNDRQETTACQDAMEANLEKVEPNPGEMEASAERQETPNEEVVIHPLKTCRNETVA
jgi:transketolase